MEYKHLNNLLMVSIEKKDANKINLNNVIDSRYIFKV